MDRKLLGHLLIFGVLVLYTFSAWRGAKKAEHEAEQKAQEELVEDGYLTGIAAERDQTADSMLSVGAPFMITVVYGGVLVVLYLLPMVVDRMSQELIGSTEQVEQDALSIAKEALADEDYPEAIRLYREIWLADPSNRSPILEIVKIQREHLKSPILAVATIEEALESDAWESDDRAFFLFRMVDLYEDDLNDKKEVVELLKKALSEFPNTRHAANAKHRLTQMGEI